MVDMNDNEPDTGSEININFDKKTESNLMKTLLNKVVEKGLQDPQPSAAQLTMETAFNGMFAQFVTQKLGGSDVVSQGSSFWRDISNSAAAHGFGESLGNNLTALMQTIAGAIGKTQTQALAGAVTNKINQETNIQLTEQQQKAEQQKDVILQLDENNPEHLKTYAEHIGVSIDVAANFLKTQKTDILKSRQQLQSNQPQINQELETQKKINEVLITEMTEMKKVLSQLQGKKQIADAEQAEQDYEKSISPDARWNEEEDTPRKQPQSANLFNNKISVNVDEIGKANLKDSFFENPKQNEIPQLIEEKDEQGNSTFRMSGHEEPKVEITTQPVKPITPKEETPKEEVKEEIKDEPEIAEEEVKEEPIIQPEVVKEEITEVAMPNIEPEVQNNAVEEKPEIKVDEDKKVVKRKINKKIMSH